MAESAKIIVPDSYKDRIESEEARMRVDALNLAVKAHEAGDIKLNVLSKAALYLDFLKGVAGEPSDAA